MGCQCREAMMAATRINEDNQEGAYRSILYLNPDFLGQQKSARRRRVNDGGQLLRI